MIANSHINSYITLTTQALFQLWSRINLINHHISPKVGRTIPAFYRWRNRWTKRYTDWSKTIQPEDGVRSQTQESVCTLLEPLGMRVECCAGGGSGWGQLSYKSPFSVSLSFQNLHSLWLLINLFLFCSTGLWLLHCSFWQFPSSAWQLTFHFGKCDPPSLGTLLGEAKSFPDLFILERIKLWF